MAIAKVIINYWNWRQFEHHWYPHDDDNNSDNIARSKCLIVGAVVLEHCCLLIV